MKFKFIFIVLMMTAAAIGGYVVLQKGKWDRYYQNKMYQPPRDVVVKALNLFAINGRALDLGCGVGNEAALLLKNGWQVWAIDNEPKAIKMLNERHDIKPGEKLITIVAKFEELNWASLPQYDLVYAANSLPFCKPNLFPGLWNAIKGQIITEGIFAGHFFGKNYRGFESKEMQEMTFLTREDIFQLFDGFEIIQLQEIEEDGLSGTGLKCHSHIFDVIAKMKSSVQHQFPLKK